MVIIKVPGWMLRDMLENSVYAYPSLDGRFATFSGIKFSFDPDEPAGSRVFGITDNDGKPLNFNREYTVAMTDYICTGGDGYVCLRDPSVVKIKDEESGTS